MKKIIVLIFALIPIFLSAQTEPIDTDGDGYRNISTLDHLRWISENDSSWTWNFELDNDINAADTEDWNNGAGWKPIGNLNVSFEGEFDGKEFCIDSLFINRYNQNNIGIYGVLDSAKIKNLKITNCNITGNSNVGGLAGYTFNNTVINYCSTSGNINGSSNVGGLVGSNSSDIILCNNSCNITGGYYVGGIAGYNLGINIINSSNVGKVNAYSYGGGLVGWNGSTFLNNCYNSGTIQSVNGKVGGIVGQNNNSIISNCYNVGLVTTESGISGGLIGINNSVTINSFWDLETSGQLYSDGGIGKNSSEMKNIDNYINAGWNFDFVWDIDDSYPFISINHSFQPEDEDGNGLININSLIDLKWLSESGFDFEGNYELDNDINASETVYWNGGLGFSPIIYFQGIFDGKNHTIYNLTISRYNSSTVKNSGFFGYIESSIIKDLNFKDIYVYGFNFVASLAGIAYNSSIYNCNIRGDNNFKSVNAVGGLIARIYNSEINNCTSICSIETLSAGGGIVCTSFNSTIQNCIVNCNIECNSGGGLINGAVESEIISCYSKGSVSGDNSVGGLIGGISQSNIRDCYSLANVSANSVIGGFIAVNQSGEINNCYSNGYVDGITDFGGFVGQNNGLVNNCFWDVETSNQETSSGGTGKTTEEMKTKSTFTNSIWNFDTTWNISKFINNGYPYLRSFNYKFDNIDSLIALNLNYNGFILNDIHKNLAVILEYRQGETLMTSDIAFKTTAMVETNGLIITPIPDIPLGDYWILIRAGGFLPVCTPEKIELTEEGIQYDFTTSSDKSVSGTTVMKEVDGVWQVRSGDLNGDNSIGAYDINYLIQNNGKSVKITIPSE